MEKVRASATQVKLLSLVTWLILGAIIDVLFWCALNYRNDEEVGTSTLRFILSVTAIYWNHFSLVPAFIAWRSGKFQGDTHGIPIDPTSCAFIFFGLIFSGPAIAISCTGIGFIVGIFSGAFLLRVGLSLLGLYIGGMIAAGSAFLLFRELFRYTSKASTWSVAVIGSVVPASVFYFSRDSGTIQALMATIASGLALGVATASGENA